MRSLIDRYKKLRCGHLQKYSCEKNNDIQIINKVCQNESHTYSGKNVIDFDE